MEREDNLYLGKKEKVKIKETEFEVRGLTLRECTEFADVVSKIVIEVLTISEKMGSLQLESIGPAIMGSMEQVRRTDELLCGVIGKPEGFLLGQDPCYFSGIFRKVISMTDLEVVKEDFFGIWDKLKVGQFLQQLSEKSAPIKAGV